MDAITKQLRLMLLCFCLAVVSTERATTVHATPYERIETMQEALKYWGGEPKDISVGLALAACMLTAIIAGFWIRPWLQRRRQKLAPIRTFAGIASEFGVSASDQGLLIRIAKQQALPTPLTLLLSGATLSHHVQSYLRTLSPVQRGDVQHRALALERGLFGSSDIEAIDSESRLLLDENSAV